jgi:hypothetical protein
MSLLQNVFSTAAARAACTDDCQFAGLLSGRNREDSGWRTSGIAWKSRIKTEFYLLDYRKNGEIVNKNIYQW